MTAYTTNFQIPYPTGTDKPCDGAAQITAMRDEIYDSLDTIVGGIKAQQDLPMVSVAWAGPTPQIFPFQGNNVASAPVIFDTLEQDDFNGAADLITLNNAITLGKTTQSQGAFIVGFSMTSNAARGWQLSFTPSLMPTNLDDYEIGSTWDEALPYTPTLGGHCLLIVTAPVVIQARLYWRSGFGDVELLAGRMWAVRIGEGLF